MLAGLAYGALWFADGFWILFAAMVVLGVGEAVQHPLSSALISRAFGSGPRRAALGVYNFAGDLGKMVVVFATAAAIGMVGWQATVAGTGLLAVMIGVALLVGLAALALGGRPVQRSNTDDAPPATVGWGFGNATGFALLSTIHALDSSCRSVSLLLLPFVLVAKGADTATIGLALALVFAGGAAGKLACGLLTERVGVVATVITTELATAALLVAMIAAPLPWVLICAAPFGLALNGTSSATYGSVGDFVAADRQARAFGLFYTVGSIAGAVAPLVFGIAADLIGVSSALSIMAGLIVLTLPLAVVLGPHLRHR